MQKLLVLFSIFTTNIFVSTLQAVSYIKDVHYVVDTMGKDFENRNVSNSKGRQARIMNGYVETYNLTALIARCEKDKHAKADITGANLTEKREYQVVINCPCAAKYILKTLNDYPYKDTITIPEDTKQRLEESWINIMQQGDFTYDECRSSEGEVE